MLLLISNSVKLKLSVIFNQCAWLDCILIFKRDIPRVNLVHWWDKSYIIRRSKKVENKESWELLEDFSLQFHRVYCCSAGAGLRGHWTGSFREKNTNYAKKAKPCFALYKTWTWTCGAFLQYFGHIKAYAWITKHLWQFRLEGLKLDKSLHNLYKVEMFPHVLSCGL